MIRCEGSGIPGNRIGHSLGCQMCGRWFDDRELEYVPSHERKDVVAMIVRGDFRDDRSFSVVWNESEQPDPEGLAGDVVAALSQTPKHRFR